MSESRNLLGMELLKGLELEKVLRKIDCPDWTGQMLVEKTILPYLICKPQ